MKKSKFAKSQIIKALKREYKAAWSDYISWGTEPIQKPTLKDFLSKYGNASFYISNNELVCKT